MPPSKQGRRGAAALPSSETYLPDLAPLTSETKATEVTFTSASSDWWVKRSAQQVVNSTGEAIGFRHHLMHGRTVIKSGVGADCARTFTNQALFLNSRELGGRSRTDVPPDVSECDPKFSSLVPPALNHALSRARSNAAIHLQL